MAEVLCESFNVVWRIRGLVEAVSRVTERQRDAVLPVVELRNDASRGIIVVNLGSRRLPTVLGLSMEVFNALARPIEDGKQYV